MWMSIEELREMTRCVHTKKLCRVLAQMSVPYKLDASGDPIVLRSSVERAFGVESGVAPPVIDMAARLQRLEQTHGKKARNRPRSSF